MPVEGEGGSHTLAFHDYEREAIGETDSLIRKLAENADRGLFIVTAARDNFDCRGRIHPLGSLRGKSVAGTTREQRKSLIQDVMTGEEWRARYFLPDRDRTAVMGVAKQIPGQEGTRVHEDHQSSWLLYK